MALIQLQEEQIRTWTRAQKDEWWFRNVYRGAMPQLTFRSAATGFLLGGVLAATALYIGAKTGISIGVGLTSVILAFALYRIMHGAGLAQDFTILENNCTQSIATAAGYMMTPLISSLGAYMLVTGKTIPWWHMVVWMCVVSIIGVLVTMALVYMRPRVRPIDAATRVGDLFREASRRAVALGPVRSDVAAVYGRARTQVKSAVVAISTGSAVKFTLERLQEGASGVASWVSVQDYTVDRTVTTVKWGPGVGNQTLPGITTDFTASPGFTAQCRPDGTCDPRTVFFQSTIAAGPAYEQLAKLSIMPLGGSITARTDWN